jgi:transposase
MRNLAIVGLTNARFSVGDVAACFGLTPVYVSMLRGRAKHHGSEGLVRRLGRPSSLSAAKLAKARARSEEGMTNTAIAKRLGVHPGTIGRRLAAVGAGGTSAPVSTETSLFDDEDDGSTDDEAEEQATDEVTARVGGDERDGDTGPASDLAGDIIPSALPRLDDTEVTSRYAGAMLLHAFLTRLGADEILSSLPPRAARRYDAASLVLASTFSFALGTSSIEGTKHLVAGDAGVLCGTTTFPHLATLRPGLRALAEAIDPVALQTAFSKAMLAADDQPPEVFYADDHFVTYWGKRAVAKGYNIRRHLAEPGRDDTFVVDDTWRAVCFAAGGEPRGLSVTLPEVLGRLREIVGDRRIIVGFDRGGSSPKVFTALAEQNMEWTPGDGHHCLPLPLHPSGRGWRSTVCDPPWCSPTSWSPWAATTPRRSASSPPTRTARWSSKSSPPTPSCPAHDWCAACGAGGASRTPTSTWRTTRASTASPPARWTPRCTRPR